MGRALCRALIEKGYSVRALVKEKEDIGMLPAGVVPFIGLLSDVSVLEEATAGVDFVIHAAGAVGVTGKKLSDLLDTNTVGTANVVNACKNNACTRILFPSTIDVYGRYRKEVLTELSEPKPSDNYGFTKLGAENKIIESGMAYTIFRISTIYGPEFETSFFKIFKAIIEGKLAIIGDGKNHLSLVHINDVVHAFLLAMENPAAKNQIYNLSDGVAYTQEGLMDTAADLLHAERPKRHVNKMLVAVIAKAYHLDSDELRFLTSNRVLDITKIRSQLGFEPSVDINKGGGELVKMFLERYHQV